MLKKITFSSDDDVNAFFARNVDAAGNSSIYLIKIIITFNPEKRQQEQHLIYSDKVIMRAGQHLRKGEQR
jgi:hypothetical protein